MSEIELKCWPKYFEAVFQGHKTFDLRLGTLQVSDGDWIRLREYDPDSETYTGREVIKTVSHVARFNLNKMFWPKSELDRAGLVVMSLKDNEYDALRARIAALEKAIREYAYCHDCNGGGEINVEHHDPNGEYLGGGMEQCDKCFGTGLARWALEALGVVRR